jgi:hypothetical protein
MSWLLELATNRATENSPLSASHSDSARSWTALRQAWECSPPTTISFGEPGTLTAAECLAGAVPPPLGWRR